MKILLVDIDSSIPNLALMKISTYHKSIGNSITLFKGNLEYYPHNKKIIIDNLLYDKTYISCIFPINKDKFTLLKNDNSIISGGTGISLDNKLPMEIENCEPDYSLYPECDYSIGFISRGCFRNCSFCFVPKKEGKLIQVSTIDSIVKHKKVKFFDNNFLGLPNHKEILKELIDKNIKFQFNQGLDIRIIDEETMKLLSKANTWGEIYFAYDLIENKEIIEPNLIKMSKLVNPWKLKCFLYVHPNHKINDVIYRITFCKNNNILPYIMRDVSCFSDIRKKFYVDLASWGNQPFAFKKLDFKMFLERRHPKNISRQQQSLALYNTNET